jgi:hypothetical protein
MTVQMECMGIGCYDALRIMLAGSPWMFPCSEEPSGSMVDEFIVIAHLG